MEMAFQKTEIPCMVSALREVQNSEQTQELRLPDGMPDIGKVLCAWGQVILRGKEWRSDSILITGGMLMWVLYLPEDGSAPQTLDGWLPFQMRWMLPENTPEGSIRICALTRFADARSVSPRKLMLRGGFGILAEAVVPQQAEQWMPGEKHHVVELLKRRYPVRLPKEAGEKQFELDEELNPALHPKKLLYYTLRPEITEQKVIGSKLAFRGNGNLHAAWLCEDGSVSTQDFPLPFSQFAELQDSFSAEARADVMPCVTELELELTEEGQLHLKGGITAQYIADELTMIETVEDAYIPGKALHMEKQMLELPAILEKRIENVSADAQVKTQGQTVDVHFLPDFPRQYREETGASLEIPGNVQILSSAADGSLSSSTARWEGKLQWPMGEGAALTVIPQTPQVPQVFAGGDAVSIRAELPLEMNVTGGRGIPMVTALESGAELQPDAQRPSLILRRAGTDSLWEIAKSCGSTVEAIRTANGLTEEPKSSRMLLIPVV